MLLPEAGSTKWLRGVPWPVTTWELLSHEAWKGKHLLSHAEKLAKTLKCFTHQAAFWTCFYNDQGKYRNNSTGREKRRPEVIWLICLCRTTAHLCFLTDSYRLEAYSYYSILTLQFSQTMKLDFVHLSLEKICKDRSQIGGFLSPPSKMGRWHDWSAVVF